jgi:tetratricopeptide (TPR) repeat protein
MKPRIGGIALAAAIFTLLLSASPSWSRNFKAERISEESYSRLSDEARAEYDLAYQLADRILYGPALDAAERAVDLQPTSIELRYFAIRLAAFLAELNLEADALRFLERAINQCQAILDMDGIPPTLRDRVRHDLNKFHDRAENIYRRDELRKAWGEKVAKDYVRAAYREDFKSEREERMQETLQALRNPDTRRSLAAQAAAQVLSRSVEEDGSGPDSAE